MFFWKRWKRKNPLGPWAEFATPRDASHRGGEVEDFVFGNVWTRIWRNRDRRGRIYYKVSFDRLYQNRAEVKLNKSFYPDDLDDLYRSLCRAKEYFAKGE